MTWRRAAGALSELYPLPAVLRANQLIASDEPDAETLDRVWTIAVSLDEEGRAAAHDMYVEDIARIRRLEDKLTGLSQVASLLLTAVLTAGAVAVKGSHARPLLALFAAACWLGSGLFLTSYGSRAVGTAIPQPLDLELDADGTPAVQRLAYERLRATIWNARRGRQLSNAIYGAQRCLFISGVMVAGAVAAMAVNRYLGH